MEHEEIIESLSLILNKRFTFDNAAVSVVGESQSPKLLPEERQDADLLWGELHKHYAKRVYREVVSRVVERLTPEAIATLVLAGIEHS